MDNAVVLVALTVVLEAMEVSHTTSITTSALTSALMLTTMDSWPTTRAQEDHQQTLERGLEEQVVESSEC